VAPKHMKPSYEKQYQRQYNHGHQQTYYQNL